MTFEEFANAARGTASRTDTIKPMVEVWHDEDGYRNLKWGIWSGDKGEHYEAPTPEASLEKFRKAMSPGDSSELAGVGAVTIGAKP